MAEAPPAASGYADNRNEEPECRDGIRAHSNSHAGTDALGNRGCVYQGHRALGP